MHRTDAPFSRHRGGAGALERESRRDEEPWRAAMRGSNRMSDRIDFEALTPAQRTVVEIAEELAARLRELAQELNPEEYRSRAYLAHMKRAFHESADRIDRFTRDRILRE